MNFEDGRARCNQDSEDASASGFLHMPMPRSDAENQIYIDLIESSLATSANSHRNTFLGITEVYPQTSPRSWVLEDGSPATHFNWHPNEPNDLNTEPFVLLHPPSGTWNDIGGTRPNGTQHQLKIVCSYYLPAEAQGLCPWLSDFQCKWMVGYLFDRKWKKCLKINQMYALHFMMVKINKEHRVSFL